MARFIDQTGTVVELPTVPSRIVSLVPSQTELLYTLGLDRELVGLTKFCVHPETWFRSKARIGGTKTVHLDKLIELAPDLLLANKEENLQATVEAIREKVPVWTSDVTNLGTALDMIVKIGELVGKVQKARELVDQLTQAFFTLRPVSRPLRTAYLIWKKPYMSVGADTFIYDMLIRCGFDPITREQTRYPAIEPEALRAAAPELILLSSEPYPFRQKHLRELAELLPGAIIRLVDGEYFSWYGSRMLGAPAYFQDLIDQLGVNP